MANTNSGRQTSAGLETDPSREIILRRHQFADFARRLTTCPPILTDTKRKRFERAEKILAVLGPDATLQRGYTITTDVDGNVIRSITSVQHKMRLRTRVSDGEIESTVTEEQARGAGERLVEKAKPVAGATQPT
ncbi:MAG: hypothetical protein DME46_11925 [Verrucomicrobia bacterium]|nr:MAG: hypothetical protein DME46_11925 [Verrucomicrobiota bacterium]